MCAVRRLTGASQLTLPASARRGIHSARHWRSRPHGSTPRSTGWTWWSSTHVWWSALWCSPRSTRPVRWCSATWTDRGPRCPPPPYRPSFPRPQPCPPRSPPQIGNVMVGLVDIRDVVDAHVRAWEAREASGRYIVEKESMLHKTMCEVRSLRDYPRAAASRVPHQGRAEPAPRLRGVGQDPYRGGGHGARAGAATGAERQSARPARARPVLNRRHAAQHGGQPSWPRIHQGVSASVLYAVGYHTRAPRRTGIPPVPPLHVYKFHHTSTVAIPR